MKRTARGFLVYTEFTDDSGNRVRVQESSSATARRCWIFAQDREGRDAVSPHLSSAQARRIAKALLRFAEPKP